ncbi:MAG: cation:proton antiporter [Myxococcales bacterium]|nr:cation:proton antiporter [Myxococcales bacterium]
MPHLEWSPLTLLLAQIGVIIAVSRLLGLLGRWLGQPLVIAEVLAGIALGPSLLGLLWPDAMAVLFPPASMPVLKMLSQMGLVLFMFLIGLELDPKLLKGRTHASVAISHTSIIVPFGLGVGAAWWLRDAYSSPDVAFVPFALFLGTAMSVTAFPVLARILSERHLLSSRVGAITIACAAVDDVTAWCLLAFVVSIARAGAMVEAVWTTALAVGFIIGMMFVVRPFMRRLGARVGGQDGLKPSVVAIVMLLLIASSTLTELIGIHALFGAFMFGAILPKEGRMAEALADKFEVVAVVLLLPLFFAYSGLRTQIGLVDTAADWAVTAVIVLLATIGKFGGSAVAARLTGLRWREASAVGVLMNTRGLMELIVLNIGLDLGVISPVMFTMLVIMALVTTLMTTPILRWFYPDGELAKDRIKPIDSVPLPSSVAPYTVLMCVSETSPGTAMAAVGSKLKGQQQSASRVFGLHLWSPTHRPSVELRRGSSEAHEGPLDTFMQKAESMMLEVRPLGFVSAEPAVDICRTAEAKQASLVLLGSHPPVLLEGRFGGTVNDVLLNSSSPVGVLVDRGLTKIQNVLVAFSGGSEDREALRLAQKLGEGEGVQLTLLHVVKPGKAIAPGDGRAQIDKVFEEPDHGGKIRVRVVEHQSATEAVLAESRRGYDLIVMGMNPSWGLSDGVFSRKRQRVLAESSVSVLVVHPPAVQRGQPSEAALSRLVDMPSV